MFQTLAVKNSQATERGLGFALLRADLVPALGGAKS